MKNEDFIWPLPKLSKTLKTTKEVLIKVQNIPVTLVLSGWGWGSLHIHYCYLSISYYLCDLLCHLTGLDNKPQTS